MASRDIELLVRLVADTKGINQGVADVNSKLSSFGNTIKGLGAGLGIAVGVNEAVQFMGDAVNKASDLVEAQNKVDVIFGESAGTVRDWAKDLDAGFRMSEVQATSFVGTIGTMVKSMGLGAEETAALSTRLAELAADIASFNNVSIEEALSAVSSGLAGESEPLRRFGIDIRDAKVAADALADGLTGLSKEQQRVSSIFGQAGFLGITGDALRTADSTVGKTEALRVNMENLQTTLGKLLLPAMDGFVSALGGVAEAALNLTGGGARSGVLDDLKASFRETAEEADKAAAKMEGDWAGTGTIFDSALDGTFALQGALEDLGLVPGITKLKDWRDALWPMAQAMGATRAELVGLIFEADKAGKTFEEVEASITTLWQSTDREAERHRNIPLPFSSLDEDAATVSAATQAIGADIEWLNQSASGSLRDLSGTAESVLGSSGSMRKAFNDFWKEQEAALKRARYFFDPQAMKQELRDLNGALEEWKALERKARRENNEGMQSYAQEQMAILRQLKLDMGGTLVWSDFTKEQRTAMKAVLADVREFVRDYKDAIAGLFGVKMPTVPNNVGGGSGNGNGRSSRSAGGVSITVNAMGDSYAIERAVMSALRRTGVANGGLRVSRIKGY